MQVKLSLITREQTLPNEGLEASRQVLGFGRSNRRSRTRQADVMTLPISSFRLELEARQPVDPDLGQTEDDQRLEYPVQKH